MSILSSGRKRITDLNDTKALQLFLSSNQPKTQIYNTDTGVYAPDWTVNKPVVSPELYIAGTPTNIIAQAKSISWYEDADSYPIANGTEYTLGTGNQPLTINRNVLAENYLKFDGSQWIDFGNKNASNAITFETWVIPSATGMNELFSKETNYKFRINNSGQIGGLASTTGTSWTDSTTAWNITITPYTLYHIVGTVDLVGGTINVYVNGTSLGQQTFTGSATPTLNANPINFGSFNNTGTEAFKGKFLTGRIYNRVLTAAEVTNNYNGTVTSSGLVAQYLLSEGAGTTVGDSIGTANGTIHGTARWNDPKKVILCEVVYTDPTLGIDILTHGSIDFEKLQTGQKGPQGAGMAMGYLSNDNSVVTTLNDGTGGTYGAPNTASTLQIFLGATDVTNQYTISQARTNVTVTEATTSATATVTNMTADTGSVVFTATRSGYPTITKTFSLVKSKMGVVGNNPTDYWLNSSVSNINAADDGSYNPTTVTFSAESQVGTAAATTYAGRFIIAESTDGNSFTTKYTSAADESSHVYTPSAGLQSLKVSLYLAGGTSVKLDDQIIPIVGNGKNSVTLSAWTPQGNIIRNAGNTVTAQADLYNGGLPATGTNYRWVKGNGAATSVIAGAGYEDLDLGRRNIVSLTSIENYTKNSDNTFQGQAWANEALSTSWVNANLKPSTTYAIQYSVTLLSKPTLPIYVQNYGSFLLYNSGTSTGIGVGGLSLAQYQNMNVGDTLYVMATFNTPSSLTGFNILTYTARHTDGTTVQLATMKFSGYKIELGSVSTPWALAYEDVAVDQNYNNMYGRNLLKSSELEIPFSNNGALYPIAYTSMTEGNINFYRITRTNQTLNPTIMSVYNNIPSSNLTQELQGQTVTFSFKARCSDAVVSTVMLHFTDPTLGTIGLNGNNTNINLTTSWKQYSFTSTINFLVGASRTLRMTPLQMTIPGDIATFFLDVCDLKVELGNAGTPWTPAPEDNSAKYPKVTDGVNNWVYKNYPQGTIVSSYLAAYSDLKGYTSGVQTLIVDGANLVQNDGLANYVGYFRTAVYVSVAKTISFTFTHDDACSIYVNGLQQFSNTSYTTNDAASLVLKAGWNQIEFILTQGGGGDGVYGISPTIGSLVDEVQADFALDYGSLKGNYGLMGYNTSSMVVNTNAVTDTDMFMCVVTYRGATYKDTVTIDDVTDPITIIINGSKLFKNGQGTNTYTAQLYQNSAEIDAAGTTYTYTWYVYNSDGSLDATFGGSGSKTGKTITLASSDINVRGKLQCTVSK